MFGRYNFCKAEFITQFVVSNFANYDYCGMLWHICRLPGASRRILRGIA
jgi:hypothetical protein